MVVAGVVVLAVVIAALTVGPCESAVQTGMVACYEGIGCVPVVTDVCNPDRVLRH